MKWVDFNYHHVDHYKIQKQSQKTLWLSLILTGFFAVLEFLGGIWSQSLALTSDSFHMFSDVLALILSMVALHFAAKKPTKNYTYGYLRVEILAALFNGLALVLIGAGIVYEAVKRFFQPEPIDFVTMVSIAVIGLLVNIVLTLLLVRSLKKENNLNIKSALWHFLGDLINSVGVILAAVLVHVTRQIWLDALISLIISLVILSGGWKIVSKALRILMEAVPEEIDAEAVHQTILEVDGVAEIHEFHLWSISEGLFSLSFHVILTDYHHENTYALIKEIGQKLKEKHGIEHVTIEIENPAINPHG